MERSSLKCHKTMEPQLRTSKEGCCVSLATGFPWLQKVDMPAPPVPPHSHPPSKRVGRPWGCDGETQLSPENGAFVGPLYSEKSHETWA